MSFTNEEKALIHKITNSNNASKKDLNKVLELYRRKREVKK